MIEKIFNGRNGIDSYSIFLIAAAWIFMLIPWTWIISVILIVYAAFRSFSKNIGKRKAEQWKFQNCFFAVGRFFSQNTVGIRKFFSYQSLKWKNRKTTLYFTCPECKNKLSLPRHKGKLAVTCTVCRHEFIKKT